MASRGCPLRQSVEKSVFMKLRPDYAPDRVAESMKPLTGFLFTLIAAGHTAATLAAETVNFDSMPPAAAPAGWTATQTGSGTAEWAVVADASAPSSPNVLRQSGRAAFPVCLKSDSRLQNGFVEVKFKPISGQEDQAGGVIWRAQNPNNYYIARANALEDTVEIYHTIKGRRVGFKHVAAKVAPATWHTLRVDFVGNKFVVAFDGKPMLEATDDSFKDPGQVGIWTKADSVTLFDDFRWGEKLPIGDPLPRSERDGS